MVTITVVKSLIASARDTIHSTSRSASATSATKSDSDDFEDLLSKVRQGFKRKPVSTAKSGSGLHGKRGRKPKSDCHVSIFLLRRNNPDFFPSPIEVGFLNEYGFGISEIEKTRGTISVQRQWSISRFEMLVIDLYKNKPLGQVGFHFANCNKSRRIHHITDCESVGELVKAVGKGKIIIIPKRDLDISQNESIQKQEDEEVLEVNMLETQEEVAQKRDSDDEVIIVEDKPQTVRQPRRQLCRPSRTTNYDEDHNWPSKSDSGDSSSNSDFPPFSMVPPVSTPTITEKADVNTDTVERNGEGIELLQRRQLLRDQDEAYLISLKADQEKDHQKAVEEGIKEEEEKNKATLKELRDNRNRQLPSEPEHGLKIRVRTLNGQTTRRFSADTSSQVLHDFIGSLADSTEFFQLILPGNKLIGSTTMTGTLTLKDLGITASTVVQVKWLNEAPTDMSVWIDADTPTITFRQRRRAAEVAEERVREWTRSSSPATQGSPSPSVRSTDHQSPSVQNNVFIMEITDEEFQTEMNNGHESETNYQHQPLSTSNLPTALKSLAENVLGDIQDERFKIIVRRTTALKDALQNIALAQNRLVQPVSVRFIGEPAIDEGGPTRELSSEIVEQFIKSSFVDGPENNLNFRTDFSQYAANKYLHLGQLTAVLLLQGGQGLPVFGNCVTNYIVQDKISNTAEDLPLVLRQAFEELNDIPNHKFGEAVDRLLPSRFEEGYHLSSNQLTREHMPEMIQAMIAHHVIQPQKMVLDQFINGLQVAGVLETLRTYPDESTKLFRGSLKNISMDALEEMVVFNYTDITPGSNMMAIANSMEQGWILLLQAAESGEAQYEFGDNVVNICLSDILKWISGASRMPAVGLPKITVHFDREAVLPKVNTCALEIYLPVLPHFKEEGIFIQQLVEWMTDSVGFGLL